MRVLLWSFVVFPCFEMSKLDGQPLENPKLIFLVSLFVLVFSGLLCYFLVNYWLKFVNNTLELLLILFSGN